MKTTTERFMDKVSMVPFSGCWLWTGAVVEAVGYGRFGMPNDGIDYAHRASWRLFKGDIPKKIFVCHHCDVRICVNPEHLFLGTPKENMRDAANKGRIVMPTTAQRLRTENQPMSKLSNDEVRTIRASSATQSALASRFGVDQSVISKIKSGITYRSLL